MYQKWILPAIVCLMWSGAGCMDSQSGGPDRLTVLEQNYAELSDAFDTDHARTVLSAMKIKNIEKSIQLMDENLNNISDRLDTLAQHLRRDPEARLTRRKLARCCRGTPTSRE